MKTKVNYLPWDVNIGDFPENAGLEEQLKFILRFGLLAPSGHNGQPWLFKVNNNNLEIFVNPNGALKKSDPTGRQLVLSIGCLVENLVVAADYYGYDVRVEFLGNCEGSTPIAVLTFERTRKTLVDQNHLIYSTLKRASDRNKYKVDSLPSTFLAEAEKLNNDHTQLSFISQKEKLLKLADILVKSQIEVMEDLDFRYELASLIKSNSTNSYVGMPGKVFGMPYLISLVASTLMRKINMSKANKKTDKELYGQYTPTILVISADIDEAPTWFRTGRVLEKLWLIATQFGISCSINAAPIHHPKYREELKNTIETKFTPLIFMRIGFSSAKIIHTPRMGLDQVLK